MTTIHGGRTTDLPYNSAPLSLLWSDIKLCFALSRYLHGVILPLAPWGSGPLDELYPSPANLWDLSVHFLLFFLQLFFILFLFVAIFCAVGIIAILSVLAFLLFNYGFCIITLNGRARSFTSNVDLSQFPDHTNERWIFINGVAVGHHWLQSNVNRLAMSFGREILGVHNPTYGFIFDLIQCLVERDFLYDTQDTRDGYIFVKKALQDPQYTKVVLILHSQGGIEGGLMIDMLLADLSETFLQKLEVYTFASAANHFNNPKRERELRPFLGTPSQPRVPREERIIAHVEHYANSSDFVSLWGVLKFAKSPTQSNRFVGSLFERQGSGHLLNQHYLDTMFTLDPRTQRVAETNKFMETLVDADTIMGKQNVNGEDDARYIDLAELVASDQVGRLRPVKEFSRLWAYRNGLSPAEPGVESGDNGLTMTD